jgi:hypothetical protein
MTTCSPAAYEPTSVALKIRVGGEANRNVGCAGMRADYCGRCLT